MREPRSWVRIMLVAAHVATGMGAESVGQRDGQRTAYKSAPGDFVVVCTLFKGRPPGASDSTPRLPITHDPRFDIGARVERVTLGESPWSVGDLVTFVIHSPTLTLGNSFAGHQFALTFSHFRPTTKTDKVWFDPKTRYLLRWVEPAEKVKR
jgi:hypothetical protein